MRAQRELVYTYKLTRARTRHVVITCKRTLLVAEAPKLVISRPPLGMSWGPSIVKVVREIGRGWLANFRQNRTSKGGGWFSKLRTSEKKFKNYTFFQFYQYSHQLNPSLIIYILYIYFLFYRSFPLALPVLTGLSVGLFL